MTAMSRRRNQPVGDKIWMYRQVEGDSSRLLGEAASLFQKQEIFSRKLSNFTLSLLYPADIHNAIQRTAHLGNITPDEVSNQLKQHLPGSTGNLAVATTRSIWQYGNSLALELDCPQFDEERLIIERAVRRITGARYLRTTIPHVTLARGWIDKVTNLNEVESAIPERIILSPVHIGRNV
jgi:hypothetical protein